MKYSNCGIIFLFVVLQLLQFTYGFNKLEVISKDEFLNTEPMKCKKDSDCQEYAKCKDDVCKYELVCVDDKTCYVNEDKSNLCKGENDCKTKTSICETVNDECRPKEICVKSNNNCSVPECYEDGDCISNKCKYNKCYFEDSLTMCGIVDEEPHCGLADGVTCSKNSDCKSNNCDDGICIDQSTASVLKWVLIIIGASVIGFLILFLCICWCCCDMCCC